MATDWHCKCIVNMPLQMEELYEMTETEGTEFYPERKRHLANRPSNAALAGILTRKRYFPRTPDPELLTWMEQLMISHLGWRHFSAACTDNEPVIDKIFKFANVQIVVQLIMVLIGL